MTILSAQTIRNRVLATQSEQRLRIDKETEVFKALGFDITPFSESKQACGMSYGLTGAGYDIRVGMLQVPLTADTPLAGQTDVQSVLLQPGQFMLAASLEKFKLPNDIQAIVHDKSTLARQGVALQNTVLEPGWEGYITLELSNHGPKPVRILVGQPIAQIVFHLLDTPTEIPYRGKYQNQDNLPTEAKFVDYNTGGMSTCEECGGWGEHMSTCTRYLIA